MYNSKTHTYVHISMCIRISMPYVLVCICIGMYTYVLVCIRNSTYVYVLVCIRNSMYT